MNDASFRKAAVGGIGKAAKPAKLKNLTFPDTAPASTMATRLSEGYPADRREQIRQGFNQLLAALPAAEKELAIPHNDLGASVAVFLVASGQSYSGVDIDQTTKFLPLVSHMRNVLANNTKVAKASPAQKREFYEEMMLLGIFQFGVQSALAQSPNAEVTAALKVAGYGYLQTFLGVDPANLSFTSNGLVTTTSPAAVAAPAPAPAPGPAPGPAPSPTAKPSGGGGTPKGEVASDASKIADQIETIGFWTKTGIGIGGGLTFNPTPLVMFRNGDALYEIEGLKFPGGLAAHRAANPDDWTKWRRSGGKYQVFGKKGWENLYYNTTMNRLPKGFMLDRSYRRVGGGGNVAVGGTSSVVFWSNLAFDRGGNFVSGSGAGSSTQAGGTGVVTSGSAPSEYGKYAIEGYTLTLRFADGKVESRMIVADPNDASVIWLDGDGYTTRK